MSPDSVLAYCEAQMQGFNSDFNQFVAQSQATVGSKTAVSTLQTDMGQISASGLDYANGNSEVTSDQATFAKINGDITAAITQAQSAGNAPLVQQLQSVQAAFNAGGDDNVSPTDVTNISAMLTTASSDIDSNSQMQMISLQSVMSQQASVLQMTTGMIQQMGQTEEKVAGNV
jgi:hypothetical protein